MMEAISHNNWHIMPYAHSPTGSVDSGVELSPKHSSYAYGSYEDCGAFVTGGDCRYTESPLCQGGTPLGGEAISPATFSDEQITPDVWEALSDTLSLSPGPVGSTGVDFKDIEFQLEQQRPQIEDFEAFLNEVTQEPNDNTLKRKRRQKARFDVLSVAHPGVDPCLVPKSGTAKPRQSRKPKAGQGDSMAGGPGTEMKQQKCYSGARVKITAKERLLEIRAAKQRDEERRVQGSQMPSKRQNTGGNGAQMGSSYGYAYPMNQPAKSIPQTTPTYITHSVSQILGAGQQGYTGGDKLDDLIANAIHGRNVQSIEEYAERTNRNYNSRGETLHHILNKLNEKKIMFPVENIHKVTNIVCGMFRGDINVENLRGETPVYRAALFGNEGAVIALMDQGADPWKQERTAGESTMHAAVKSKNPNVVRVILNKMKERGVLVTPGINLKTFDGNTALHKAAALSDMDPVLHEDLIKELIRAGADTTIKNNMSQMAHSFLPESLKEVQNEMKRLNGRRRAHAHQAMAAHSAQVEAPSFYNRFQPHYAPHLPHPPHLFTTHQQFNFDPMPQSSYPLPATCGQQYYPQVNPVTTTSAGPYFDPRSMAAGTTVLPGSVAQENQEYDLSEILSSSFP